MRGTVRTLTAALLIGGMALAGLAGSAAQAAKFKVLHSFCESHHLFCGDGSNPGSSLAMDQAGNFFGTTSTGGQGVGTVFELERKPGGSLKFKTLYRFCTQGICGHNPNGPLVIDTAGNLYGTASNRVFELSPGGKRGLWTEKLIHGFCSQQNCTDGNGPVGGLTYAGASSGVPYDGVSPLYGVTGGGGANNAGTVFELINNTGAWSESVLYSFCSQGGDKCTDGKLPISSLIVDAFGDLFGTALEGGGKKQAGVAFELSPNDGAWNYTSIYSFCSLTNCADGKAPDGPLTLDGAGTLLGITAAGGATCTRTEGGCGTIFRLSQNDGLWQQAVIHSFCQQRDCKDGAEPIGAVTVNSLGDLYGATTIGGGNDIDDREVGGGVVYELASDSSFRILHRFCSLANCVDGEDPEAGLVMDTSGSLYGTTNLGGAFAEDTSGGTVFRITP